MAHAVVSPSGASRWSICTRSPRLEETFPDNRSEAADEGTLAHELAELKFQRYLGLLNEVEECQWLDGIKASKYYCAEMEDYVDSYVAYTIGVYEDAKIEHGNAVMFTETEVDLTDIIPEGFGTVDIQIIAGSILRIIDLKYGKGVRVEAIGNKQLKIYAYGAYKKFGFLFDKIDTVSLTIYQPRIGNIETFEISLNELIDWAENELKPKAQLAFDGMGDYIPGSHCMFCRAKVLCKANAQYNLELAKKRFTEIDLLTDKDIVEILAQESSFTNWINSITEYALKEALQGRKWEGFKLVRGRGKRAFIDDNKVMQALYSAGIDKKIFIEENLLSISKLEKALGKKKALALIPGELITKSDGALTLVPESDKRDEHNSVNEAMKDFDGIGDEPEYDWI